MRAPALILLAVALLVTRALGCGAGFAQSITDDPAAGDAARGQRLYLADGCYECHGTVGQGGAAPRIAPGPLPASVIALYIRKPANVMPPYAQTVVGDQDVRDIQAYLASIPRPPPLTDIPMLAP